MSRYIDADDAIERLGAYLMADAQIEWGGIASEDIEDWKELASDILKGTPSIDIVRCKDCQWFDSGKNDSAEWHFCKRHFGIYPNFDADDFCSYGEKEEFEEPNYYDPALWE